MKKLSSKKIKILVAVVLAFCGVSMFGSRAVYADNCLNSSNSINITNDGIQYIDQTIDESTATYEETEAGVITFTLNDYKGGDICVVADDEGKTFNLVLEGDSEINVTDGSIYHRGFTSFSDVTISGDGSLTIKNNNTSDNGTKIMMVDDIVVESGTIKLLDNSYGCRVSLSSNFEMTGGNFYTECNVDVGGMSFYQNGGNFEIKGISTDGQTCLASAFTVFDGGTTSIDCTGAPAIGIYGFPIGFEEMIEEAVIKIEGNIRYINFAGSICKVPLHGLALFNDGDITLKSDVAAIIAGANSEDDAFDAEAYLNEKGKDYFIMMADDMVIGSSKPVVDAAIKTVDSYKVVYSTITDGTEGVDISMNYNTGVVTVSDNVLKTAHITKGTVPVPDTDDEPAETEENPNTVDARIGFLAFGILVAVLAECGIIIDLYRRLFGIKEQITEAEGIEEKTEYCDGKA
ncbi:hypothetical protein IJI94_01995 [Candidatus Saccharibacteria bacterium]|nr:hypothetical protein [Candidatus Saccharibacteria bacterium]